MKNSLLFAILLAQSLISSTAIANPVSLESREVGKDVQVIVHNTGAFPVSIKASLSDMVNTASDHAWPILQVVPANTSSILANVYAADKVKDFAFKTSMYSMPGQIGAVQDPAALYRLPYPDGSSYPIVQAIGGPITTHNSPINLYAVDFDMPEGTPVVAARDGTVIQTESKFSQGGKDPYYTDKANYVRILHADGTIGIYAHLMHEGVTVSPGQVVTAGTVIGYSGSTGFSGGPHLHFAVTHVVKTKEGFDDESLPILFYVGRPAHVFELRTGSLVEADYPSPVTDPATISDKNIVADESMRLSK